MSPSTGLRTVSLRVRVTVVVTVVVAVVVAVLVVVVDRTFAARSEADLSTLLNGRAQLARQLARTGAGPQQVVNRVSTSGVQASLELRNGRSYGVPVPTGPQLRRVQTALVGPRLDGILVLTVDTDLLRASQRSLRRTLLVAGLGAVLLCALLVGLATRYALAPLTLMAGLARGIADGRRGDRLAPTDPTTELGRTATAFDDMLDALEGAEARAMASEARTRAFLADAAHELRTPIAGVQSAAEALLHDGGASGELARTDREQLQLLAVREARRAGGLVADLLTAARLDAGEELRLEPVDLGRLALAERERVALTHPEVTVVTEGRAEPLVVDREKVTGIVRNLVDNAVRAAGPGGAVRIAVRDHPDDAGLVQLLVTDTGPGVPAVDRERVFDRLVRLDAARTTPGSGLGLPIARGWAAAHSGTLACVDPPSSRGAAFLLTLPRRPVSTHRGQGTGGC